VCFGTERFPADGRPDGLGLRPVAVGPLMGGSSVQAAGRVRPDAARRAAHGSGNEAALTITALGLVVQPRRGKANPAPALLLLAPVAQGCQRAACGFSTGSVSRDFSHRCFSDLPC
jgi:hypothetical protein